MLPLLDLTHNLLTRGGATLTITVVVTPHNLPIVEPLLSIHSSSSISALVLPFPPHPSIPVGIENIQYLPPGSFLHVMSSLQNLRQPLLRWFCNHSSPPCAILSDFFLGWTHRLAQDLGIKRLVFSPGGSFAVSVSNSLWKNSRLPPRTADGRVDENGVVLFDDVVGQPGLMWCELSGLYRTCALGEPGSEFLRAELLDNVASWGWVFNSFDDLEGPYLSHLKSDMGHDRIWAVGPSLPAEGEVGSGANVRGGGSGPIDNHVLSWLDTCENEKVVYVCFGSEAVLSNEQLEVLAVGLERSGVRFVWKIKEPNQGHVSADRFGKLPTGFEDRVAGRGLIIRGWAPQISILRHRAVGVLLTQCGWNSMLEGVSTGTMMLTWSQGADQFPNSKLLVEQLKAGIRVSQNSNSLPDPDELARVLAGSVSGAYKEQRSNTLGLKKMAAEAVSQGGTSTMALHTLIQHLSQLPKPLGCTTYKRMA